jgi:hypothetical protein
MDPPRSVPQLGRHQQCALASTPHGLHAFVPASDHLSQTQAELVGFVATLKILFCSCHFSAVTEFTGIPLSVVQAKYPPAMQWFLKRQARRAEEGQRRRKLAERQARRAEEEQQRRWELAERLARSAKRQQRKGGQVAVLPACDGRFHCGACWAARELYAQLCLPVPVPVQL